MGVEVGGDVTSDPRVGVLAPSATGPFCLLVDREVVEAGLGQLDCAEDARHPGANDRKPKRTWLVRYRHLDCCSSRLRYEGCVARYDTAGALTNSASPCGCSPRPDRASS